MAKTENRRVNLYINGKEVRNDIASIKKEMFKLVNQQSRMTRGSKEYVKTGKKIRELKGILANHNKSLRNTTASWHGMKTAASSFRKHIMKISAAIAVFTTALYSIRQLIRGNIELSDSFANVMKTTGLTRKEVGELYTDFRSLNTRTPRNELLLLAEEAGRLGKKSKKDVLDFVKTANMIKVALGDDLGGEEAIRDVGKLTEIYQVGKKYGVDFGESMMMVGSAINEVSANSQAQAGFLIELTKRMAGVSSQADISVQDIIGYAAALDQMGQSSEISSTTLNKVIVNMFKDVSTYAEIAGEKSDDFYKLLKTDANEALLMVLEGLNGNNEGLSFMATKLDDLGLNGSRSIQVLASLASNIDLVREQQDLANKSLEENTSLTEEYNVKNNNMAGNLQKIGQTIRSYFINSGINKTLSGIVDRFAKLTEVPVSQTLEDQRQKTNILVMEYTNLNTTTERQTEIFEELEGINEILVQGLDKQNVSLVKLHENLKLYNEEMIKSITIAKFKEDLDKKNEAYSAAQEKRVLVEFNLRKQLLLEAEKMLIFDQERGEKMKKILTSNISLNEKYQQIHDIGIEYGTETGDLVIDYLELYKLVSRVKDAKEEELSLQKKADLALNEYTEKYKLLMGIYPNEKRDKDDSEGEPTGDTKPAPPTKEEAKAAEKKKRLEEQLAKTIINIRRQIHLATLSENEKEIQQIEYKYDDLIAEAEKNGLDTMALKELQEKEIAAIIKKWEGKSKTERLDAQEKIHQALITDREREVAEVEKKFDELIRLAEEFGTEEELILLNKAKDDAMAAADADEESDVFGMTQEDWEKLYNNIQVAMELARGLADIWAASNQRKAILDAQDYKRFEDTINRRRELLDRQLKQGTISQKRYNLSIASLDEQLDQKKSKLATEQAKREKKLRIFQANINIATAILQALGSGNPPYSYILAAISAALGAVQLVMIKNEPVPEYGFGGYSPDKATLAWLGDRGKKEWVASGEMVEDPVTGPIIEDLHRIQTGQNPQWLFSDPVMPDIDSYVSATSGSGFAGGAASGYPGDENFTSTESGAPVFDQLIAEIQGLREENRQMNEFLTDPNNRRAYISHDLQKDYDDELSELQKLSRTTA